MTGRQRRPTSLRGGRSSKSWSSRRAQAAERQADRLCGPGVTGQAWEPLGRACVTQSPSQNTCVLAKAESCADPASARARRHHARFYLARLTSPEPPSRAVAAMPRRADGSSDVVFCPCLQTGEGVASAAASAPRTKSMVWAVPGAGMGLAFVGSPAGQAKVCTTSVESSSQPLLPNANIDCLPPATRLGACGDWPSRTAAVATSRHSTARGLPPRHDQRAAAARLVGAATRRAAGTCPDVLPKIQGAPHTFVPQRRGEF